MTKVEKNLHITMIEQEYAKACEKHPKFCDELAALMPWDIIERNCKAQNSNGPLYASNLLDEEIAEAMNAYQQGDPKHCLQELAQCCAVILRMMQFVQDELLTCSTGPQPATTEA